VATKIGRIVFNKIYTTFDKPHSVLFYPHHFTMEATMPISWTGTHILIDVGANRLGTVTARCEGFVYKKVEVTFSGGPAIPPFPTSTCPGIPGAMLVMSDHDTRTMPALTTGLYWVEVTHEPVPCPPSLGSSPPLPFIMETDITQMRYPGDPNAPEGKVYSFQLLPGENVHVTIVIEPGSTGGGGSGGRIKPHRGASKSMKGSVAKKASTSKKASKAKKS
jgi:hypothetical protein